MYYISSAEEDQYWRRRNSEFICEALEKLCKKKFSKQPIMIRKQECYGGEKGRYYICLDYCHDITQVYDANQEIYNIPAIKVLLDERETCYRIFQETKTTLTIIEKETFYLGNVRHLDAVIEKLFSERVEQLPKLKEIIETNQERIKKIKKELTVVFADFISKLDY